MRWGLPCEVLGKVALTTELLQHGLKTETLAIIQVGLTFAPLYRSIID